MKNNDLFYKLASDYNLEFEDGEMTDEDINFFVDKSVDDILNTEIKLDDCARDYFLSVILEFCETFLGHDREGEGK